MLFQGNKSDHNILASSSYSGEIWLRGTRRIWFLERPSRKHVHLYLIHYSINNLV